MRKRFLWLALAGMVSAVTVVWLTAAGPAGAARAATQVPLGGTGSPRTGDFTPTEGGVTEDEFPEGEESDEGPDPYDGTISLSGSGSGGGPSVNSGQKAKSNPTFNSGFEGLNHYQQRYSRGGNQFSVEPPDQGLCVGNGYVVEAVNDVLNVFDAATGASALPDNTATNIVGGFPRNVNHAVDLNSFYGYGPAVNRTTGIRAEFVTDPTCLYDAATQRFFLVVLTLEVVPATGAFTTVNHLDLAVSQTSNPTGSWNIYKIDVTNDGTNTGGREPRPIPRRLSAHRGGRERHLSDDERLPVVLQRFQRRADLCALEGPAGWGCGERDDAAFRHLGDGERPERGGLDPARLHAVAGSVPRDAVQRRQPRDRVLDELQRRRRGAEARHRLRRHPDVEPVDRLDADEHGLAEHGEPLAQPQQRDPDGRSVRRSAQAAAARLGHPGRQGHDARGPTGRLHQRHDDRRRSPASVAGGCWSALRTAR